MRSPEIPPKAETITTYESYHRKCGSFLKGHYNSLVIVGRPGIGKTTFFEQNADQEITYILRGKLTPLGAYMQLYVHQNKLLVIDDGETFWSSKEGRVILRDLCETSPTKTVHWVSTSQILERQQVPNSFKTVSRVAIVCNRFVFGRDDETAAILDRSHVVSFDPINVEVYRWAANWFWDQKVMDCVADRLYRIDALSGRLLIEAWEEKEAGGDWKALVDRHCYSHTAVEAVLQSLETESVPVERKAEKFMDATGKRRATYFNVKSRLKDRGQLRPVNTPKIAVKGKVPDTIDIRDAVRQIETKRNAKPRRSLSEEY